VFKIKLTGNKRLEEKINIILEKLSKEAFEQNNILVQRFKIKELEYQANIKNLQA
jgi:hypothetical protein